MALKTDLVEHRPRGQGHVVNNMSGAPRSPSHSPGTKRKTYNGKKEGKTVLPRTKERKEADQQQAGVTATQHFVLTAMKSHPNNQPVGQNHKKEGEHKYGSNTPYPRCKDNSRERGGASQRGETYRMPRGD